MRHLPYLILRDILLTTLLMAYERLCPNARPGYGGNCYGDDKLQKCPGYEVLTNTKRRRQMNKRVIKRMRGVNKAQGIIPEEGISKRIPLTVGKPWPEGKMTIPQV